MKTYFAQKQKQEIVKELGKKITRFGEHIEGSGLADKWRRSYRLHYGKHMGEMYQAPGEVQRVGDQGELSAFAVNHYRNLTKHILALTTSQKPSFDPKAKNSDLESLQQARLANNILDAYVVEKRMSRHMVSAAERGLVFSKGFVYMTWEPSLGRPYGDEPVVDDKGQPVVGDDGQPKEKVMYEGDVEIKAKSPFDVIYDPQLQDWSKAKY